MGMIRAWAWHRSSQGTKDKTWARYWRGTDKAQVYGHNTGTDKQGTGFYCTPSLNKYIIFYSIQGTGKSRQGTGKVQA